MVHRRKKKTVHRKVTHRKTTVLSKAQRDPAVRRIRAKRKKIQSQLKKLGHQQKTALKKAIKKHSR
jgi:hypothetical protein